MDPMEWSNQDLYKYFLTNERNIRIKAREDNTNMNDTVGIYNANIINNRPLFRAVMRNGSLDGDVEAHIKFLDDELQRKLDEYKNTENGLSVQQTWLRNEMSILRNQERQRQRRLNQGQGGRRRKSMRRKSMRKKSMRRKSMRRK
jgi:hypothetical protein